MTIGLFVDGSFVYKSYPDNIDYLKLRQVIEKELSDTIDEAYFFNSDDDPPKAAKFNKNLTLPPPNGPGFRLKIYWLTKKKLNWPQALGGHPVLHPTDQTIQFELIQQKGVDVGLAYHMVRSFYKRHWTKLVLCAGDGEFHEPVQNLVESENVDLYLVGSLRGISSELRPYARKIFEIDQEPLCSQIKR
ncbi:MAG TPA: NYN domain-containing protein [Anaerolineales bacterium]|nr:NYN domain-containing protein [Anaerolineales bacterium]